MSTIESSEVVKIAHLARLGVSEAELSGYARDLSAILDFVARLESVDTVTVQPMAHPLDEVQRLRLDEVTEANRREQFQAIAPSVDGGYYLVPRVIE